MNGGLDRQRELGSEPNQEVEEALEESRSEWVNKSTWMHSEDGRQTL